MRGLGKCYICYEAEAYSLLSNAEKISKWFETWYAQGNCSCLSIENRTLGTRDEVY